MNDYLSKPLDDRLLYRKIIELVKGPDLLMDVNVPAEIIKCIDLTSLKQRTKGNPELMMEMIELYLKQTPALIRKMKKSVHKKEWESVYEAAHKLIPSFSIMGMNMEFETMAKLVQEYSRNQEHLSEVKGLAFKLENVCSQACVELKAAYNLMKNPL